MKISNKNSQPNRKWWRRLWVKETWRTQTPTVGCGGGGRRIHVTQSSSSGGRRGQAADVHQIQRLVVRGQRRRQPVIRLLPDLMGPPDPAVDGR
uniref:Uncharacterized protein n=1 Tax=Oryza sativa subsp. japonica TaxID=39947 RepID=Q84ZG2_ORYSJ|nr:hypothetical protein [Oryza sativa Japonica Group]